MSTEVWTRLCATPCGRPRRPHGSFCALESLPHPSECGRLDSGVFALSLQRHDAINTDCGGTSEMALCEIRPAQAPGTETVRFQRREGHWKAKYYWWLRRMRPCRANRSYRRSCRLARLSLGCGPRRGSLTVLVHTPYSEARCIHAHTCIS